MSIYIALGANLSTPEVTFERALDYLRANKVSVLSVSSLWQSPAWPSGSGQPDYINAAAHIQTRLKARALLALLHECEAKFGRVRGVMNAARTLDLDLLDYKGQCINSSDIEIPHPRMTQRGFVLLPLSEIAPHWHDPIEKRAIQDWIARLPLSDVEPMRRLKRFKTS